MIVKLKNCQGVFVCLSAEPNDGAAVDSRLRGNDKSEREMMANILCVRHNNVVDAISAGK